HGKLREHGDRMGPQPIKRRLRAARIAGRKNASAGPRCFLTEIALVEHRDVHAGSGQEIGGGQTDDAAAENHHVRGRCHEVVIGCAHATTRFPWQRARETEAGRGSLFLFHAVFTMVNIVASQDSPSRRRTSLCPPPPLRTSPASSRKAGSFR